MTQNNIIILVISLNSFAWIFIRLPIKKFSKMKYPPGNLLYNAHWTFDLLYLFVSNLIFITMINEYYR